MSKHPAVYWESMTIFATPLVPATIALVKLLRHDKDKTLSSVLPLGIVLASLAFMFSGGFHPAVWGPDYSKMRFAIIGTNCLIVLCAALTAILSRPKRQIWTFIAALMLTLVWAFVYAINSVV